ncbi:MAG: hypothetical protein ACD_45C00125G0001 [uncultured bacterium]|nr:MAG: hypothetical protein ACD_45C00125G0001 [uncultured bacterium]
MKILLTGGSGDLGKVLAYRIEKRGDVALRLDAAGCYHAASDYYFALYTTKNRSL